MQFAVFKLLTDVSRDVGIDHHVDYMGHLNGNSKPSNYYHEIQVP